MMNVGRLCVKTSGREAGKNCAIIDVIDSNYVIIDGQTKRRKCNVDHLTPLHHHAEMAQGAPHEEVMAALRTAGIETQEPKKKKWQSEDTKKD